MENKCPHCGRELPQSASFCMYCCRLIKEKQPPLIPAKKIKTKFIIPVIILIVLLSTASAVSYAMNNARKTAPVKTAAISSSEAFSEATVSNNTVTVTEGNEEAVQADKEETIEENTTAEQPHTVKNTSGQPVSTTNTPTTIKKSTTSAATTAKTATTAKAATTTEITTESTEVIINGNTLTNYPGSRTDSAYTIPYHVTAISKNAFNGNRYLKTLKFSKQSNLECDWDNLFSSLPNLETIYIYAGTTADTEGMKYFNGEIIYYYD